MSLESQSENGDENKAPNIETSDGKKGRGTQRLNSILNWNKLLNFEKNSVSGGKRRRKNKKSCKNATSPLFSDGSSNSASPILNESDVNDYAVKKASCDKENVQKRIYHINEQFRVNRTYFEEFPVYRKEYLNPRNKSFDDDFCRINVKEEIKSVPRYCHENIGDGAFNCFKNKKVCLVENDEYLFHSRSQLLLKLKWYGARTLAYYSSRTDYVICSSTYEQVLRKILDLQNYSRSSAPMKTAQENNHSPTSDCSNKCNLRGVVIGRQVKLTEIEFLELVGENLEIAINSLDISRLFFNRNTPGLHLVKPKMIWDVIGNRDSMDELYTGLLNLRIHSEDLGLLNEIGLRREMLLSYIDNHTLNDNQLYEELCGIYLCVSPYNIGTQICSKLTAIGCGYMVKLYKGSDIVDPIIKQWRKGNFFKMFNQSETAAPVCTIISDCSNIIRPKDLVKITNSYYGSVNLFEYDATCGKRNNGYKGNPGAIIFVLEEASEVGQYVLSHCSGNNRSYGCSRSHTLCILDGTGFGTTGYGNGVNTGFSNNLNKKSSYCSPNTVRVIRFRELSKSSILCKLVAIFKNPPLIDVLITQFGSNLLKISNFLHWIYLTNDKEGSQIHNIDSSLSTVSLYYSPVLHDSVIETPLIIIQKCMLNHNFSSIKKEIWNNSIFGLLEDQPNVLENLYNIFHDIITTIVSLPENKKESTFERAETCHGSSSATKCYSSGFQVTNSFEDGKYVVDSMSKCCLFLRNISEMDTMYQLDKSPHLTYHSGSPSVPTNHSCSTNNSHNYCHGGNGVIQSYHSQNNTSHNRNDGTGTGGNWISSQNTTDRTCESYFSTLYISSFYGLIYALNDHHSREALCSKDLIKTVGKKLAKYSPINSSYSKFNRNYHANKRQESTSYWKYIEYLSKKGSDSSESTITWRTISIDSHIVNLLYRYNAENSKSYDVVSYIPSKIPRLSIRIPEVFKQK